MIGIVIVVIIVICLYCCGDALCYYCSFIMVFGCDHCCSFVVILLMSWFCCWLFVVVAVVVAADIRESLAELSTFMASVSSEFQSLAAQVLADLCSECRGGSFEGCQENIPLDEVHFCPS